MEINREEDHSSGMHAFDIGGLGVPVIAEITKYPSTYTGPTTFTIEEAGTFYANNLASGSYDFKFSNPCVPPIIEKDKIITDTEVDLPPASSVTSLTLKTRNNEPGIAPNRPTTEFKKVYFTISRPSVSLAPVEYWANNAGAAYYEYTHTYGTAVPNASSTWHGIETSEATGFFQGALIESDYTVAQMKASTTNNPTLPTLFFRVKGDISGNMIKIATSFTNVSSSTSTSRFRGTPRIGNCNLVDVSVALSNFDHATFSFEIQVLGSTSVNGSPSPTPLASKRPSLEELKLDRIEFPAISTSGYAEFRLQIVCLGDAPNVLLFGDKYSTNVSGGYSIVTAHKASFSRGCESDLSRMYVILYKITQESKYSI